MNGSGRSPRAASYGEIERRMNGRRSCSPSSGRMGWCGTVDAWSAALQHGGRMSLRDVLAPAIELAELTDFLLRLRPRRFGASSGRRLRRIPSERRVTLLPGNRAPRPGESSAVRSWPKHFALFPKADVMPSTRGRSGCDSPKAQAAFSRTRRCRQRRDNPGPARGRYRGFKTLLRCLRTAKASPLWNAWRCSKATT